MKSENGDETLPRPALRLSLPNGPRLPRRRLAATLMLLSLQLPLPLPLPLPPLLRALPAEPRREIRAGDVSGDDSADEQVKYSVTLPRDRG